MITEASVTVLTTDHRRGTESGGYTNHRFKRGDLLPEDTLEAWNVRLCLCLAEVGEAIETEKGRALFREKVENEMFELGDGSRLAKAFVYLSGAGPIFYIENVSASALARIVADNIIKRALEGRQTWRGFNRALMIF